MLSRPHIDWTKFRTKPKYLWFEKLLSIITDEYEVLLVVSVVDVPYTLLRRLFSQKNRMTQWNRQSTSTAPDYITVTMWLYIWLQGVATLEELRQPYH